MFAPPVAKPKSKAAEPQRTAVVPQRHVQSALSPVQLLQRRIGNQALMRLLAQRGNEPGAPGNTARLPGVLQAKLKVGAVNDPLEHEADRVAGQVMRMPEPRLQCACPCGGGCPTCQTEHPVRTHDRLQIKPDGPEAAAGQAPLPGTIQAKLVVGQVDDPLEHEADRVADQVMQMPAPGVSAAAAPPQLSRKCDACEEGEKLQMKEAGPQAAAGEAPAIVHEVLRSPGQPLDSTTRSFMEPRFGYDFGRVRIHNNERAAASARAVNASAYTVGKDVVFGAAQFAPHTIEGRNLLAHELTHVVQQSHFGPDFRRIHTDSPARGTIHALGTSVTLHQADAGAATTARAVEPTHESTHLVQREVEVKVDPGACNLDQHRKIEPAVYRAREWLSRTIPAIDAFLSGARTKQAAAAATALGKHFHSTDAAVVAYVKARLETIQKDTSDTSSRENFRVNCPPASDRECGTKRGSEEYVAIVPEGNPNEINLCGPFFDRGEEDGASTIIHEFGHAQLGLRQNQHIVDRAYQWDKYYPYLTTAEALINAESYAMFAREVATGFSPAPGPISDDIGGSCPTDWVRLILDAMTKARMWNHRAALSTPAKHEFSMAYKLLDGKLTSEIGFKCILDGGGRCPTSALYWYIAGDLRICPSWRQLHSPDDRAVTMLAALYGYKNLLDGSDRRIRAAIEARRLHSANVPSTEELMVAAP